VAEDSANYSFNKSHSISYAILSAWTSYLKFKYPQDFFLSLLRMTKFEPAPQEEIKRISQELSHFGIELLPPDLSRSRMDFSKEGTHIRFGLNSIKGVSEKSLEALQGFRDSETPTKYDIFLSAKQAGLNIGILSALVQAGALSGFKTRRSRLVLEAQTFNLLTDREKRNFIALGEKFDYDVLRTIDSCVKQKLLADDGRPIIKDSRFETFKKKYLPYKAIYDKNKKYEQFANWYFENQLLGYSYTISLKDTFSAEMVNLLDSEDYYDAAQGQRGKYIGVVEDSMKRVSRNGNPYIKIFLNDEKGRYEAIMTDNSRSKSCTRYLEKGRLVPQKGNIVVTYGSKGEDIIFANDMSIVDEKIYMKLSDLK
jgi:DNA polymerase III alpha subunit